MITIAILETNLTQKRVINNIKNLVFERDLYRAGKFKLVINQNISGANEFKIGRLIVLNGNFHKVGIIKQYRETVDTNGEKIIEIKGFELKGIVSQRITIPPNPTVNSHQSFTSEYAETIIKSIVNQNCVANRPFPLLEIETDQNRGSTYDFSTRYRNLEDELEKFCTLCEMGYEIYIDADNNKLKFEIIQGIDHSYGTSKPVYFASKFANLEDEEYLISYFDSANYAVVGGQGEGTSRTIIETGTTGTGFDLYETFVDARDINTTDELTARGNEKLAVLEPSESFDATIIQDKNFKEGINFNLGDIVTFITISGLQIDKRIEKITEYYEKGIKDKVEFKFGNGTFSVTGYVNNKTDKGIE